MLKNWQWNTVFKSTTATVKSDEILPEDCEDENFVFSSLDKMLDKMLKMEEDLEAI